MGWVQGRGEIEGGGGAGGGAVCSNCLLCILVFYVRKTGPLPAFLLPIAGLQRPRLSGSITTFPPFRVQFGWFRRGLGMDAKRRFGRISAKKDAIEVRNMLR